MNIVLLPFEKKQERAATEARIVKEAKFNPLITTRIGATCL